MQELLSVTHRYTKATNNSGSSSKKGDYIKPEFIKKQYDEYNNQIQIMNEVFQSSMNDVSKLKEPEEALKRSSYLLKRSMLAAIDDK